MRLKDFLLNIFLKRGYYQLFVGYHTVFRVFLIVHKITIYFFNHREYTQKP